MDLLQDSPLPSTATVRHAAAREGLRAYATFKALTLTDDLVYDRQDMFYVPFAGLQHVAAGA